MCHLSTFILNLIAFFDLSRQKTEIFRFYLILVTIPVTLIAAVIGLKESSLEFLVLPDLIVLVLFAISIAGLIMTAVIVDLRFDCIVYAKTVNLVRRFFIDKNQNAQLRDYLLMPDGDDYPKFNEQPWEFEKSTWKWHLGVGATFLEVVLMGLLDATYFGAAITYFVGNYTDANWSMFYCFVSWILFFSVHVAGYLVISKKKDADWKTKKKSTKLEFNMTKK